MKFVHGQLRRSLQVLAFFAVCCCSVAAQQPHTLTGDIRSHKSFHSNILNNDRDVLVYLPPGYDAAKSKHYPVLYMHDGQNLFDGATSFIPGKEWRADEAAERLIAARRIEPLIIVAVYNTKDRIDEYTPAQDKKYKAGGKADLYGRMLVEELKPFIDAHYRTRRGAKFNGLAGSSLGGLASLYLALKYPNVFGLVAAVSPSVWFADKQILRYVDGLAKKPNVRIWMDMGTKEGKNAEEMRESVNNARLLEESLIKKKWSLRKDLMYFEAEGAEHNETAWAARMELILTFLFPRKM